MQPEKHDQPEMNYSNTIVVNRIAAQDARSQKENLDPDFGAVWRQALHGGTIPKTLNPNQWVKPYESDAPSIASEQEYINVEQKVGQKYPRNDTFNSQRMS